MSTRKQFRKLLEEEKCIVLPGAYDCISARIIEKIGFKAMDVTGLGIEAARLGQPDLGLASMSEVVDQAWNIANSVSIPVIFDADTGYGGLMNVARTVKAFEQVGIAGIHIEDQAMPKRCGNLSGKQIIPLEEMAAKIKVAKDVLTDKDFIIISRCDGKEKGIGEVKRRMHAYLQAGADLVMPGDDYSVEELRDLAGEFYGKLYLVAGVYAGEEMCLPVSEYADMGVKVVTYPIVGFLAAARAIQEVYEMLQTNAQISVKNHMSHCMTLKKVNDILEIEKWLAWDKYEVSNDG